MLPCLPYDGTRTSLGYGLLPRPVNGSRLAARAALAEKLGRPVQGVTRHTCDNPPCVEPTHLIEGSHADNMDDAWTRGRSRGGRYNQTHCKWGHELTPENVSFKRHRSTRKDFLERVCVACRRRRNQELAARRKAERAQRKEDQVGR